MLAELGSVEGKSHFSPDKKSSFCRPSIKESDLRPKSQGWVRLLKVGGLLSAYKEKEAVLPLHEHRQRESLEQLANPITNERRRKIK